MCSDSLSVRSAALLLVLFAASAAGCSESPRASDAPTSELRSFTGSRARLVWVQGDGTDPFALGQNLALMGLDTDDGKGERSLLAKRGSYVKPLLTPSGNRVLFSTGADADGPEMFIVNWDGTGLRQLGKGFALTTWLNPVDNVEWVYVGTDNDGLNFATVSRFPIDNPAASELVWNKTLVSADTFQVSADGRQAGGLFPWPEAGIAELPNRSWRKVGEGCWTAMSTVRGPLFWYFDGSHRNLTMVDARTDKRWTVPINTPPGFENPEVYHPRWTNHPRFLVMTGPYNRGGANQVRSGGTQSELWLGRFSEDFSRIESWVRATTNAGGDAYPDVWIDRSGNPYADRPGGPVGPASSAVAPGAPGGTPQPAGTRTDVARAVLETRLVHAGPIPSPPSILPYRHALVVNEYEVVRVVEGTYAPRTIRVAQWAIRDSRVLPEARRTAGAAGRLIVERYDAHPELEGERLVTDLGASDLPLYYEVRK